VKSEIILEKILELLNLSGFAICLVNKSGKIILSNELFQKLFNCVDNSFYKTVEGKEKLNDSILNILFTEEFKVNLQLYSPFLSKWFALNSRKLILEEEFCLIILEDLTEKRNTFENYISSLTILDNVEDGIYLTDFDNRITYWNRGAEKIYGYSEKEVIGKIVNKDFKLYDEIDETMLCQIAQDLEKYRTYYIKRKEYRKDNSEIWIEGSVTLISDFTDKPTGFLYIIRDITSKLTSEILNYLNANLQNSLREITADILSDLSFSNLCFRVTKKCKDLTESNICAIIKVGEKNSEIIEIISDIEINENILLELKKSAFLIKKWLELNKTSFISWDEINSEISEELKSLLKVSYFIISPVIIKNYVDYFILTGFNELFLSKFKVEVTNSYSAIFSFIVSYYERKILQEALEEKLRETQKSELISTLINGIVHDFKNILNGIQISLEWIKTKKNSKYLEKWIKDTENLVNHGIEISKSLLNLGKPLKPHKREFPINELFNEIYSIVNNTIPRNINFYLNLTEPSLYVYADYSQLHQVFMNLILNAIDAMPNGGDLKIKTELVEISAKEYIVSPKIRPGSYIKITIIDTGSGIPNEIIHKIFEPYFTTKERSKGTGLGLFVSKNIIMNHGGYIEVESEIGMGTTFKIYLPCLPKIELKAPHPTPKILRKEKPLILLVDDEEVIRSLLAEMLSYNNFEIVQASSGEEAYAFLEERINDIDIAIVDYFLKDSTGLEILEKIKLQRAELPVFIATGVMDENIIEKLNELKADKIIEKPFEFDELVELINNYILLK